MLTQIPRGKDVSADARDRTIAHSELLASPSTPPQPIRPTTKQPQQRKLNKVLVNQGSPKSRVSGSGTTLRPPLYVLKAGFFLLAGAILASPTNTGSRMGTGVFAVPCNSGNTTTSSLGDAQQLSVTPTTNVDLTSVFNCEGGDFEVFWSGAVNVRGTIVIGSGTTVSIFGDGDSVESVRSRSDNDELDELTSGLGLPLGLTSEAVGVGPPDITSEADTSISFGPMFYVNGGNLVIEDLIVRGGYAANNTGGLDGRGGGVHAVKSTVSVARCDFSDNFAEHWGGGIFTNQSTLEVVDSVFTSCRAGFVSTVDDEDLEGAGGGIWAELSKVIVDGCLFEECYAKRKGGGVAHKNGNMSVVSSVFYGNRAGGENIEHEDETGEGAGLTFEACHQAFDGLGACGVNDTTFRNNRVAKKGGAVAIGSGDGRSDVEFHRCTVDNSSTGKDIKDDPQGEGGGFSVGGGVTLLLSDCVVKNNHCGKKGGAFALSSGDDWIDDPGAILILRNSSFTENRAKVNNGGVVNVGEFAKATVEGDANVFEGNTCGEDGGVFASTVDTLVTVEGGTFNSNACDLNGGVFWSMGNITILGGTFTENESFEKGGVFHGEDSSLIAMRGGSFENNRAQDGAVAAVRVSSTLLVEDGVYTGNVAERQGGVFSSYDGGGIQITGGTFVNNAADYGGFLYKECGGNTTCTGASILQHQGVDGGAIHAVDGAVLDWACDMGNNSALAGPAVYARDGAIVELRGISLIDNRVARGSVVFVVDSTLTTYQVDFEDSSGSSDISAVQVDQKSSYMAEYTSFTGFDGEAVVFSEGKLFMDDCDFCGSTASVLVYSQPSSTAVIRNTALGDNNYLSIAKASSEARELPNATPLTNVKFTCGGGDGKDDGSTSSSPNYPCSKGSACLEGDVGVYCRCYQPMRPNSTERCVSGDPTGLNLGHLNRPEITYFPGLIEGDLLLSYKPATSSSSSRETGVVSSGSDSGRTKVEEGSDGGGRGGVLWSVEPTVADPTSVNWTVLPSRGLLLPGENITLRVAALPSTFFDGTDTVTFQAVDFMSSPSNTSGSKSSSSDDNHDDDDGNSNLPADGGSSNTASFDVTFFHCAAGSFWVRELPGGNGSDEHTGTCEPCNENEEGGETQGVDCSEPGETLQTLSVKEGYWRAALNLSFSRECFNEGACKGGSNVSNAQEYCNDGYEGVVCSVCSKGYGRGAANQCHLCSPDFKGGMFFVLSVLVLVALVVIVLLGVYLVGGRGAVSSTVASTKQSVIMLQTRSADMLLRSGAGGVIDFSGSQHGNVSGVPPGFSSRSRFSPGRRQRASTYAGRSSFSSNTGDNGIGRTRITGLKGVRVGSAPVTSDLPRRLSFAPRSVSSDVRLTPALAPVSESDIEEAPLGFGLKRTAYSEPGVTPAYVGSAAIGDGQRHTERTEQTGALDKKAVPERDETTAAGRIGELLSALPLSKLKIVIVVWQISGAFADVTNVGFPPIYEKFLAIIGIFSLDLGWLLSATCVASGVDFYDKLLIVTIGPVVLLGLLGVTFHLGSRPARPRTTPADEPNEISNSGGTEGGAGGAAHANEVGVANAGRSSSAPPGGVDKPIASSGRSLRSIWKAGPGDKTGSEQDRFWELFARHTTMTLIILYLVYSQVSTVVFQTFACDHYPEISKHYLRADGRIECNTPTHMAYMVYAAIMVGIYPFGIPAAFCYLLVRQRSAINPLSDKSLKDSRGTQYVVQEKINQRANDESVAPTSFLWSAYYPNRYYFEVFECMRRLLLTGLLVFVPNQSGQVAYGCIFAFISLLAFELQRPHMDGLEIQLYRTGCLVIFFTNFLALIIHAELADENSRGSAVYSVLLILVHVFFFLTICWNSWATIKATFSRDHFQGLVLGVDLVDGDGADRLLGPKKAKRCKVASSSESEYKMEDGEELPAWQDQPAIPEMHVDNNGRNSRRSILSSGSTSSLKSGGRSRSNSSHTSNASSRFGNDHPDNHSNTGTTSTSYPFYL